MERDRQDLHLSLTPGRRESRLAGSGRLVLGGSGSCQWLRVVRTEAGRRLLVDLGGLTQIDARGVGLLLTAARQARRRGGDLQVVACSPRVARLIELSGLASVLGLRAVAHAPAA